mmetsp:Transcript_62501/g.191171  ORF Transcript_62501/g.191171 Transcript_62501/m.191171 type:complete len:245 (-) Transcript_62501:708-1442(-)
MMLPHGTGMDNAKQVDTNFHAKYAKCATIWCKSLAVSAAGKSLSWGIAGTRPLLPKPVSTDRQSVSCIEISDHSSWAWFVPRAMGTRKLTVWSTAATARQSSKPRWVGTGMKPSSMVFFRHTRQWSAVPGLCCTSTKVCPKPPRMSPPCRISNLLTSVPVDHRRSRTDSAVWVLTNTAPKKPSAMPKGRHSSHKAPFFSNSSGSAPRCGASGSGGSKLTIGPASSAGNKRSIMLPMIEAYKQAQ